MPDLLLTLGHNASAIAVSIDDDGTAHVVNAYELERLSGVKSDSRFPIDAIVEITERSNLKFERVYVTHWDPSNLVDGLKSKYWDRSVVPPDVEIITQESRGLTHHDCHALAALQFAGDDFPKRDSGVLVVDGFGNFAEHLSYYVIGDNGPILVKRIYGYGTSLGLMYQYATAFLGMKMHEDEYKLLGYGAQVNEVLSDVGLTRRHLDEIVYVETKRMLTMMRAMDATKLNPDLGGLPLVQEAWADRFRDILQQSNLQGVETSAHEARAVIGYVVQGVLENTITNLFESDIMKPTNLIMTGGVAFNVELNRRLLGMVPGKLCVMPIAGDQGNSIGLWAHHNRRAKLDMGDLCWGVRKMDPTPPDQLPDGLHVFSVDCEDVYQLIKHELDERGFVNLVRGRMEFGPRALCNTTTLAVPRTDVAEEINRINGRDSVMPFAPVVAERAMSDVFHASVKRLHKTERFMVCAVEYANGIGEKVPGAALRTSRGLLTGRPQSYTAKYDGDSVARVLDDYSLLINTSFNVHGVPICCDLKDVVHSHQFQRNLNPNVVTIVITGEPT